MCAERKDAALLVTVAKFKKTLLGVRSIVPSYAAAFPNALLGWMVQKDISILMVVGLF